MESHSFDLVQQPWIDAVDLQGRPKRLGLYPLLEQAHELRNLDEANPLVEAATLRLLLALTHRIVQGPATPRDWRDMYAKGRFDPADVKEYFSRWQDRFDLFHPEYPFMQTAGLRNLDKDGNETTHGVQNLSHAVAKGSMKTLFDHHADGRGFFYEPRDAVRHLLATLNFALSGLNRKACNMFGMQQSYYQANMVGGIVCTLHGATLFETLALNTLLYGGDSPIPRTPEKGEDAPVWEWEPHKPEEGAVTPRGWLHYLTARCRHVLLLPEQGEEGTIVRRLHIAQGEHFPGVDEPFFPRRKNKDGKPVPVRPQPGRMLWRDSLALFGFSNNEDLRPESVRQVGRLGGRARVSLPSRYRCCAYALAYDPNKTATALAWRKESLSVPLELLENQEAVAFLQVAIQRGEQAESVLYKSVAWYLREVLPEGASVGSQEIYRTQALDQFWTSLEAPFQTFLLALADPDGWEKALQQWEAGLRHNALAAFQRCVWQRYGDQGKSYHAWVQAEAFLRRRCETFA